MTDGEYPPYQPPEEQSQDRPEGAIESSGPWGHAEWLTEVQRLEKVKDDLVRETSDPDVLALDPDFNFLLGKLDIARGQLIAHTAAETHDQIEEQD